MADILEESRNPAIEAYRAAYIANSSNSTPNSNSNPSKKGKNKKKGKKKASYNIKGQNYSTKSAEQASFILGSYNLVIEEEEVSDSSSDSSSSSNSNTQLAQLLASKGYKKRKDFKGKGLKTFSNNKAKYKDNQPRRCPRDPALYNMEIPSDSIRKEDYRPIIEDAIVSEAIEPKKRYKLRNSPAKGTTLEGIGPSLRGKRPCRPTREPNPLTGTRDLPYVLREPVIEGNKVVEKAISSPTLKEPNIGQRDYYNLLNLAKLWHVRLGHIGLRLLKKTSSITKGLPNFDKIKEADFHCSSCDRGKVVRRVSKALIPDLPRVLDSIEGDTVKIRPRPYNRNPIVLLLVNCKTNIDSFSDLDNLVYDILAPTLAKLAKITPAVRRIAAYKAKRRELAKACTTAYKLAKKKDLRRSKRTTSGNAGRYTTNSSLIANKDDNNAYNRVYMLLANMEEEEEEEEKEGGSSDNNSVNGSTSDSANKGKDSGTYKRGKGALRYKAVLGSKTYLVYIPSRRAVLKTSTVKFIEDNTVLSQPTNNTALEGELVDLDQDLEGAVSLDPSNLNTEKPISIEIGLSKLEPYESSSNCELDEPLPDKPINPVIVESIRPTISIRKPELLEAFPQTIEPIFTPKPIEVIGPNQPITNEPLDNSNLILEGDKMQLNYYKLLAKTSSYILSFVYKARKRVISKDSTPTTYKQALKLPRDKRSKWLEAITKEFIQLLELGVFKFLPRSLLPSNYKLITCRNVLKVKKDAKNRPIKYKSRIPPTWRILLAIVTYIDNCLFIGPDIGYITDLKKRLNKVYAIEDLGPAAYFLGVQILRDRPNRRL
ncbi:hypothetical protein P8C59_007149 [Phyllachora maydis]|uniref:GAG-pre-integrase domain-containing protein n=1 Tax=Phyllachora maydis TaxID=1825666 RepID=A0AAD9I934_9PEZI|nr:hypothetical protein P8C59_007149 [Phyllachora maydis]